ncbi:hypothetical protein [Cutibacterium modestum]|nr:hypothetical protein [Cutibacterium modestum]
MSDLFVVAEAHPYWPSPISRRDDDPVRPRHGNRRPQRLGRLGA